MNQSKTLKQSTVAIGRFLDESANISIVGGGVILTTDGVIVTCWHVFWMCQRKKKLDELTTFDSVYIRTYGREEWFPAELYYPKGNDLEQIRRAINYDLVLLKIVLTKNDQSNFTPQLVPLTASKGKKGDEVIVISYSEPSFCEGEVIREIQIEEIDLLFDPMIGMETAESQWLEQYGIELAKRRIIKLSKGFKRGTSGGAVFHKSEKIIGLVGRTFPKKKPAELLPRRPFSVVIPIFSSAQHPLSINKFLTEAGDTLGRNFLFQEDVSKAVTSEAKNDNKNQTPIMKTRGGITNFPIAIETVSNTSKNMEIDPKVVHKLLKDIFTERELKQFIFFHFRVVYDNLGTGMGKNEKIDRLIEHCYRMKEWPKLFYHLIETMKGYPIITDIKRTVQTFPGLMEEIENYQP